MVATAVEKDEANGDGAEGSAQKHDAEVNGEEEAEQQDAEQPHQQQRHEQEQQQDAEREDAEQAEREEAEREEAERERRSDAELNKPLLQITSLFWTWFTRRSETKAGRLEACGMLAICLARAVELVLQTEAVRILDGTLNSRNLAQFKVGLLRITLVSFGGSLLQLLYSYLQARLTWKWRYRLTDHVHSLYFRNKAYYFVGEGGGVGGDKLSDPDHRIVSDLSMTAQTFSDCFSDILFSGTAGVFYTLNLARLYSWRYAIIVRTAALFCGCPRETFRLGDLPPRHSPV